MKVLFTEKDRNKILARIKEAMGSRKLAEMVEFGLKPGELEITISKMGTSILRFQEKAIDQGLQYELATEKIAFTHRAFKDEVKDKILKVVEAAGGKLA